MFYGAKTEPATAGSPRPCSGSWPGIFYIQMKSDLSRKLIKPFDLLSFSGMCQICHSNPADNESGFVCRPCKRNTQPIRSPWCEICGLPEENSHARYKTCIDCNTTEYNFSKARSLFMAKGLPQEVIHRFKYNQHEFYEPLFKEWLAHSLELDLNQHPKAIIPIPLHRVKKRERGFNQVETIARILSSHMNIRIEENLLRRVKMTDSQTHLSRSKRISNVKNAFICTREILKGCYLLVDDVMTTGSTANACAKVLLDNGASSIEVLTITRGIPG